MTKNYLEDTAAYLDTDRKERILEELYHNAIRTIHSVYLFKHFDEYIRQLSSDQQADKKEVYWHASYHEKMIDYVKICISFETFNKAVLLDKGYIIHQIKKQEVTASLYSLQQKGTPILLADYLRVVSNTARTKDNNIYLTGFRENFPTISFAQTLNGGYPDVIGLDSELCYRLKRINEHRNRLHFFTDFKGAFSVHTHIAQWKYIKETALETIEKGFNSNKKALVQ